MAIKKESLIALLIKTGVAQDETKAKELIEAQEEKEVSVPETTKILSGTEYTQVVENLKTENIKVGKELAIKDLKEKAGVEFDGKNPDKFIEAFKTKIEKDSGTSVDEKVKQRDKTIAEMKTALEKVTGERDSANQRITSIQKDSELMKHFPKNRDDRFSDNMYLSVLKSEYEFAEEDGKPVVKKNGEVLKDDKFNLLTAESVINSHFTSSKWIKEEAEGGDGGDGGVGGRGGKNKPAGGNTFVKLSEFQAKLEKDGIHPGSEKATALLNDALKANPQMDMNS
jgi:hypothetical protein